MKKCILIGGVSGVGKSHISRILADKYDCVIMGTDSIREIQRTVADKTIHAPLFTSSFLAGHSSEYGSFSGDEQKNSIIQGFLQQKKIVELGIKGAVNRIEYEGKQLIVEGIHAVPGVAECREIFLYIKDENIHKERLKKRTGAHRNFKRYLDNFQEIRWIQNMLLEKCAERNIFCIENGKTAEECIEKISGFLNGAESE